MGYDDNTPLKGVTGGGLPAEIWQAVMAEIHEGLPVESLGSFAFDPDSAVPQVVSSGGEGAADPLAAALSEALGQPAPQQGQAQPVEGGRTLPDPGVQTPGGPPTFPAETITSGPEAEMPPPGADGGTEDALTQALRGIQGVYQE